MSDESLPNGGNPEVSGILSRVADGEVQAANQLLPQLYDELRSLAAARLASEKPGQTLQATALVHEAYLRLVGDDGDSNHWDGRGHFFAAAAEAMRRILVDRARKRKRPKHGGDRNRVDMEICCPAGNETPDRLLAIDEALEKLDEDYPDVARLLKLRYFAGLPLNDAANLLNISTATAKRRWALARAFLYDILRDPSI